MELPVVDFGWRKSSRCETGDCVEAARLGNVVAIRDSVHPETVLQFTMTEWTEFAAGVRQGEFDSVS